MTSQHLTAILFTLFMLMGTCVCTPAIIEETKKHLPKTTDMTLHLYARCIGTALLASLFATSLLFGAVLLLVELFPTFSSNFMLRTGLFSIV